MRKEGYSRLLVCKVILGDVRLCWVLLLIWPKSEGKNKSKDTYPKSVMGGCERLNCRVDYIHMKITILQNIKFTFCIAKKTLLPLVMVFTILRASHKSDICIFVA